MSLTQELVRLWPFWLSQVLYWVTFLPASEPCFLALVFKCLPVLALIYYVGSSSDWPKENKIPRKIMFGLIFGVCGDASLVYQEYFVLGMVAFGIGHLFYISAFHPGRELNLKAAAVLLVVYLAALKLLLPHINDEILVIGMPLYGILLLYMVLCSISKAETPVQWISAISAALFAISDFIIVVNMVYYKMENSQFYIMLTYYLGQLGITLTASEIFVETRKLKKA